MAAKRETTPREISVLKRLGSALNRCRFPSFCLKPLKVKCFEYLLKGQDVVAVLPTTGFLACQSGQEYSDSLNSIIGPTYSIAG